MLEILQLILLCPKDCTLTYHSFYAVHLYMYMYMYYVRESGMLCKFYVHVFRLHCTMKQ